MQPQPTETISQLVTGEKRKSVNEKQHRQCRQKRFSLGRPTIGTTMDQCWFTVAQS